jgi:membrane fusion protein, multidrug efflux system
VTLMTSNNPAAQANAQHVTIDKKSSPTPWGIGAILVGAVVAGGTWWMHSLSHVSTNDARIEGHIHPLNARVSGTIVWVNPEVEDTHYVEAGTVLARLDPNDYQPVVDRLQGEVDTRAAELESAKLSLPITQAQSVSRLQAARASVAEAEAEVAASIAGVSAAEARAGSAEAAHRRAEDDRVRYEDLVKSHEISRSEYDQHATDARTAQHQVEAAKAGVIAAQRQVEVARQHITEKKADVQAAETVPQMIATAQRNVEGVSGQLKQSQAALHNAKLDLSYTQIVAPVSGIISRKSIEAGQRVQLGDLLLTVVPLTDIWVTAEYKETQLSDVHVGQPVSIHVDTYGHTYSGRVESIGGATGSVSSALPPENSTGNFVKVIQRIPVRIRLDNLPSKQEPLLPGMSAEPTVYVR